MSIAFRAKKRDLPFKHCPSVGLELAHVAETVTPNRPKIHERHINHRQQQ
jgi:hypothetical protein